MSVEQMPEEEEAEDGPMNRAEERLNPDSEHILPGILLNQRLTDLALMLPLGYHMSTADSRAIRNCLHTSTLEYLQFSTGDFDVSLLCEGFEGNRTLTDVEIELVESPLSDADVSRVISSLHGHRTLRSFQLRGGNAGNTSFQAIRMLLATSNCLSKIYLEDLGLEDGDLQIEYLVDGLKQSSSLKDLSINNLVFQNEFPFFKLFNALHHCPTLQHLGLSSFSRNTEFPSLEDIEKVISSKRQSRPLTLQTDVELLPSLGNLLRAHPEIRIFRLPSYLLEISENKRPPKDIEHIAYMNYHGRYLLDRPKSAPSSLWPLVFERANDNASLAYEFLKGPAFAGRQTFL